MRRRVSINDPARQERALTHVPRPGRLIDTVGMSGGMSGYGEPGYIEPGLAAHENPADGARAFAWPSPVNPAGVSDLTVPPDEINAGFGGGVSAEAASELASALEEAALAREQLHLMKKALMEERIARLESADQARRELSALREELSDARHSPPRPAGPDRGNRIIPVGGIALAIIAAGFLITGVGPMLPPLRPFASLPSNSATDTSAAPADGPSPPPTESFRSARSGGGTPQPEPSGSPEFRALARLNDVLRPIPGPAMPSVLRAVNKWLVSTGQPPCSLVSSTGEISMTVGPGINAPLLTALSRCADAVEQVTAVDPGEQKNAERRGK